MISNTCTVVMTTRKIVSQWLQDSVKSGFGRSTNHASTDILVNLIFREVIVRRSGVRLNFKANTTGNTLTDFSALADNEFYLSFVRSK